MLLFKEAMKQECVDAISVTEIVDQERGRSSVRSECVMSEHKWLSD
jgi:hypothetical protein